MRLKFVESTSFRFSELTNYNNLAKGRLKKGDVACFVSLSGDQVVFVHPASEVDGEQILRSLRLRLTGRGSWNPLMLRNYAKRVGIDLEGLTLFEDHYRKLWNRR